MPTAKRRTAQSLVRRVLFLLITVLVIALPCVAQSQTAAPPCTGSQLSLQFEHGDSATGHVGAWYSFKNDSQSRCTLKGYPALSLLDRAGRRIPRQKIKHGGDPSTEITLLEPGGKAFFEVDYASCEFLHGAADKAKSCKVARKVRIEAPGTKRAFILRTHIDADELLVRVSEVQGKDPTVEH